MLNYLFSFSSSFIPYLFCSHPHICRYISHWKRTGEHPPNFRSLSSSSTCPCVVPFSPVRRLSDRSDRCMALMENLRARYTDVKIAFSYFVVKVQHAYYTMICLKSPVFPFLPAHPAPLWNRRSRSNPAGTAHTPSTVRSSADSLPAS